jgi:DegV family protein with EDD domain
MPKIAIVTDSVACIPEALIEKLKISWVAYYIHRGQEVLRDLVTITRAEFFEWMKNARELPKTASPGPGDYLELYETLATEQDVREIISIHITSKGSGAFQAAKAALPILLERIPDIKVEIIDTLNVSMCQGWMAIEAARAAMEGKLFQEIITLVNNMIPKTKMIQTADTLKYLYMGGRIGKAQHLVGSLLSIKPLISMLDGEIVSVGTARSRKKAYEMMADLVEKAVGTGGRIKIAYVHAAALEEVEKIKQEIEKRLSVVETIVTELSPALGVHTGPGTAGFCYYPVS